MGVFDIEDDVDSELADAVAVVLVDLVAGGLLDETGWLEAGVLEFVGSGGDHVGLATVGHFEALHWLGD